MSEQAPEPASRLVLEPIGYVRTPFATRQDAPRQAALTTEAEGRIELHARPELEHALSDLEHWSHIWVIFWFHLNQGWHPKVEPPRSAQKRGVFSTRSPYRPNPIGLSVVALERIERCTLFVRGLDLIDGTPVLDLKPYVPYADIVRANSGWLDEPSPQPEPAVQPAIDPGPSYRVSFSAHALAQLDWLEQHGVSLRAQAELVLRAGPSPHAYRRIRREGARFRLGLRDFRLYFRCDGELIEVVELTTGYRHRELADPAARPKAKTPLEVHRAFVARFGFGPTMSESA